MVCSRVRCETSVRGGSAAADLRRGSSFSYSSMLRCASGFKDPLGPVAGNGRCDGEGVDGSGSGLEMPERGLTFVSDGEAIGSVGAELRFNCE